VAHPIDILYLTHNYPRSSGDFAGRFVARLAEKTAAMHAPVGVLAPHCPDTRLEETMNGVRIWRFRYGSDGQETLAYRGDLGKLRVGGRRGILAHLRFMRSFTHSAKALVQQESPRVIHAHWWIPAGWIARGLRSSGRLIVTMHGTDLRLLRAKRWLRPLAARVLDRADIVTVVSSWMASVLQDVFPRFGDRLRIAPMPPDDEVFHTHEPNPPTRGEPLILSVTRFTAQKRNGVLLKALAILRDRGISCRARLIGEGPMRSEIVRAQNSLKLGDRIELRDPMPQSRLADQYREADLVVLPAVDEGFGMVLVEPAGKAG
jgi:glycosyltransferase involved in cell wall biosynthesis